MLAHFGLVYIAGTYPSSTVTWPTRLVRTHLAADVLQDHYCPVVLCRASHCQNNHELGHTSSETFPPLFLTLPDSSARFVFLIARSERPGLFVLFLSFFLLGHWFAFAFRTSSARAETGLDLVPKESFQHWRSRRHPIVGIGILEFPQCLVDPQLVWIWIVSKSAKACPNQF
jgi:hypothetical protein